MDVRDETFALVQRARGGDREAFERLAQEYRPRLIGVIEGLLGQHLRGRVEVEDVCQELFLRAFRSMEHFAWQGDDSMMRWLSAIGRNVVLELARKQRTERVGSAEVENLGGEEISPSRGLRREERFDRLQEALAGLAPDDRKVIQLARLDRLPLKEVAQRMDRSHAAVRQLLRRALRNLKHAFGDTESLHLPQRASEADDGV